MKTSTFKNAVLATAVIAALAAQGTASAASEQEKRAGTGFGVGALVGAAAGPVGMLFGAVAGKLIADNQTSEEQLTAAEAKRIEAEAELVESRSAMAEMKQNLVASNDASHLIKGGLAARNYSLEVLFRTASRDIEPQFQDKLDTLAAVLDEHPRLTVNLEGFADNRGDVSYNQTLSEQRIDAVKQVLVGHGIDAARINATAYGESRSAGAEHDVDGWALERRVSISIADPDATKGVAELKL